MRVLFYEPDYKGHHFPYFARMLPAFLELPVDVGFATTQEAYDSDEFKRTLAPFENQMEILPVCRDNRSLKPLVNAWQRYSDLKKAISDWKPDHTAVLYADGLWPVATLAKTLRLGGLDRHRTHEAWMYRGQFGYEESKKRSDKFRRWFYKKMIQTKVFDKIHFDDELMLEYHKSLGIDKTEVVLPANPVLIRDPLSQLEARAKLNLPAQGRLISISGMISRTKGIDLALHAFAKIATKVPDAILLLAGPHQPIIKEVLAEPEIASLLEQGRVVSRDVFLNEEEMLLTAEASDLVLAPYPRHSGRSSIILWAAAAGTPVLSVARGCIGHVVRTERLGKTCDVKNLDEFSDMLASSLEEPWKEEDVNRVRTYAKSHSIEEYQRSSAAFTRSLCEAKKLL